MLKVLHIRTMTMRSCRNIQNKGVIHLALFSSPAIDLLSRAMDASHLRQQVISHNVANADTPFYQSSSVRFEDLLQQALDKKSAFRGKKTDERHMTIGLPSQRAVEPTVVQSRGTRMNNNHNNVDIDAEMSQMAKNSLWYQGLAQSINHELQQIRHVISEGRG